MEYFIFIITLIIFLAWFLFLKYRVENLMNVSLKSDRKFKYTIKFNYLDGKDFEIVVYSNYKFHTYKSIVNECRHISETRKYILFEGFNKNIKIMKDSLKSIECIKEENRNGC